VYRFLVWLTSNTLVFINEVALRWARLVLGWVTHQRAGKPSRRVILEFTSSSTQSSAIGETVKCLSAVRLSSDKMAVMDVNTIAACLVGPVAQANCWSKDRWPPGAVLHLSDKLCEQ